jgi:peptidoglycan hydrolase-like protein with peptidoglycan-binding domain
MLLLTSVGEGGGNNGIEVKIVQMLLNAWLGDSNENLLKVDGIAGPLTKEAISSYQKWNGGAVDGRVDPNGRTIKSLVQLNAQIMKKAALNTPNGRRYFEMSAGSSSKFNVKSDLIGRMDTAYVRSLRSLLARQPKN